MRKRELEITDTAEILHILDTSQVIHLGLTDGDGTYVVPMNYGYTFEDGRLTFYIHGAVEGYKYEMIKKTPRVSFAMECDLESFEGKVACQYGMAYSSLLGKGEAKILTDPQEKMLALTVLMKTQTGKDFEFDEKLVSIVSVVSIAVTEYSAKKRPKPKEVK